MAPQTIQHGHEWHGAIRRCSAHYTHAHLKNCFESLARNHKKNCVSFLHLEWDYWIQSFFSDVSPPLSAHPPQKKSRETIWAFFGLVKVPLFQKTCPTQQGPKTWKHLEISSWTSMACPKNLNQKKQTRKNAKTSWCKFMLVSPIDLYKFREAWKLQIDIN